MQFTARRRESGTPAPSGRLPREVAVIVTCPACQTRYLADDAALGGEAGRRVRCASCGNLWHFSAEAAAIHLAVAAVTAELAAAQTVARPAAPLVPSNTPPAPALRAEPGTEARPLPMAPTAPVRPAVAAGLPTAAGPHAAGWGGPGLMALAAALIVIAVLARDRIIALYPSSAPIYQALRLTKPPGPPLRITSTVTHTSDSVIVAGDIVNNTQEPQQVTRVRVTLRDGDKHDLESRTIAPPLAPLPPGETAHYTTTFEHPSITAVGADVTFATN